QQQHQQQQHRQQEDMSKSAEQRTINSRSLRKKRDYFIPFDAANVFTESDAPTDIPDDVSKSTEFNSLKKAFEARYIWTRKAYMQHAGIQSRTVPSTTSTATIDTTHDLISRSFNYL